MSGPRLRRPCDVPSLPHGLDRARLFPCGWRCSRHWPGAWRAAQAAVDKTT